MTAHMIFVLVGVGLGGLVVVVLALGLLFKPVERWVRRHIFGEPEGCLMFATREQINRDERES